tara:strand:- start:751 stop:1218 length:468 start_codon:yes stop_codon:yes gene_type:complete
LKKFLIPIFFASSLLSPVKANIDRDIAEMCMKAVDFKGCVETISGGSIQKRMSIDQGVSISEGNSCPQGYAYIGESKCQVVRCKYAWHGLGDARGNEPLIAGKSDWKCTFDLLFGNGILRLGASIVPVTNDSKCPDGNPALGWNSTCEAPYRTAF